jgi:hypothetical protein
MSCLYLHGAGRRRNLLRHYLSVAALGAGMLAAGPAAADSGDADVVWLATPSIIVEGNGNNYGKVDPSSQNIDGKIRVELDAGVSGRVKSWEAWPVLRTAVTDWKAFKGTGTSRSQSYSTPRPKTVNEEFFFSIPWVHYAETVVAACNARAAELRGQGLGNGEIFSQDRPAKIEVDVGLSYDMSGLAGSDAPDEISYALELSVICKAIPPRVPNPIADSSLLIRTEKASNYACELRLHGVISSHDPNLQVKFRYLHADGQQSDLKTVTTDAQGFVNFTHIYPLSPGIKNGKIRMVGEGPTFQSDWEDFDVDCGLPTQDVATVLPPKAAAIVFAEREYVAHRGLVCPSLIAAEGLLEGRGTASGAVALFAGGQLKKLQQYSIEDGQSILVQGEHTLTWGPTQAQQSVTFAMNVTNATADVVDQFEKTQHFVCRKVETSGVAQGAVGGVAPANPAPTTHSQQAAVGQLALPQGFAIQAPQGLVRKGEIRLTGSAANGKYALRFLRKNGGGYVAVNTAQLPKQMTGLAAGFPLKALTGGRDWRIEVCPAGGAPAACKTADFRLTRLGAAGAAAKAPSLEQPQGTTIFLVPGVVQ